MTSKIFATISSLVPFWVNTLIQYYGLGSEYSMTLNVTLTQLLALGELYLSDNLMIAGIGLALALLAGYRMGYNVTDLVGLRNINTVTICGYEEKTTYQYPVAMEALSALLIAQYQVTNVLVCPGSKFDVIVGNLTNHQLEKDLYVTVTRDKATGCVTFTLQSYTTDLDAFVKRAMEVYTKSNYTHRMTLYGKQTPTEYDYSELMRQITYVLVNKYGIRQLIAKTMVSQFNKTTIDKYEAHDTRHAHADMFMVEECKDRPLDPDDVYLTVKHIQDIVLYTLVSNTVDMQTFMRECQAYYEKKINASKYTYHVMTRGRELAFDINGMDRKTISYPVEMSALNHVLIDRYGLTKYHVQNGEQVLDGVTCFAFNVHADAHDTCSGSGSISEMDSTLFDDVRVGTNISDPGDIVLRVEREANTSPYSSSVTGTVVYTLNSNSVNVVAFLETCQLEYELYLKNKHRHKVFHFTLTGFLAGTPVFHTETLFDDSHPIFETFDNLHNEHVSFLKADMARLRDLSYYQRTGLKRKKSYLFYGEPGCGKTSSVVAMSIHDQRHIIDIPFCLLTENAELETIMNLSAINNIKFERNQVIYLFDEIDTGLTRNMSPRATKKHTTTLPALRPLPTELPHPTPMPEPHPLSDPLNLGKILSKFDGICNYNGIIIVATTNCKDNLDPALYREMRLTPVHFTFLRRADAVDIVEKFFQVALTDKQKRLIPDREIAPSKLVFLCEKHETMAVDAFLLTLSAKEGKAKA